MKAAIIGSGAVGDYVFFADEVKKCDCIICADGGIKHLIEVDIPPHVFIGDFDSCEFDKIKNTNLLSKTEIYAHNPVKDDTDMQLCIDYALNMGIEEIAIFAALGGRIDHELSNIFHLKYILDKGARGIIISDTDIIYITNDCLKIKAMDNFNFSIVSLTEVSEGITLKGLRYTLENADLRLGSSLGISNVFTDEYAEVSVKEGLILVILSKESLKQKD